MLDGLEWSVKGEELGLFGRVHTSDCSQAVPMREVDLDISSSEEYANYNLWMAGAQSLQWCVRIYGDMKRDFIEYIVFDVKVLQIFRLCACFICFVKELQWERWLFVVVLKSNAFSNDDTVDVHVAIQARFRAIDRIFLISWSSRACCVFSFVGVFETGSISMRSVHPIWLVLIDTASRRMSIPLK